MSNSFPPPHRSLDIYNLLTTNLLPLHQNPAISCNLCSNNNYYITTPIYCWWSGLYSNAYCVFKMKTKVLGYSKEVVSLCHILVPFKSHSEEMFNTKIPVLHRDLVICFHIEWFRYIYNIERHLTTIQAFSWLELKLSKSTKITRLSGRPTFFTIALKHLDREG